MPKFCDSPIIPVLNEHDIEINRISSSENPSGDVIRRNSGGFVYFTLGNKIGRTCISTQQREKDPES
jgi:nucleosome binding factor SPN SPT16 subunit